MSPELEEVVDDQGEVFEKPKFLQASLWEYHHKLRNKKANSKFHKLANIRQVPKINMNLHKEKFQRKKRIKIDSKKLKTKVSKYNLIVIDFDSYLSLFTPKQYQ